MTEIFQNKASLHFGATVFISCFHEGTNFYMYANGVTVKTVLSIADKESPYDPSWCLFVIKPPMKFKSQETIDKMFSLINDDSGDVNIDDKKTKTVIQQFQFQLKQNLQMKNQQDSYPIRYQEQFMLQHVFSSNYLCFQKVPDSNQYNLELTDIPNSRCFFNLKACYGYQKDIHTYVPFNSATFLNVKFQQGLHLREMALKFIPNSIYDSWIFSEESSDKLKIELYQTSEEIQSKTICFGDFIWIFHLQSGSFAKLIDDSRQAESLILKKIKYTLGYSNTKNNLKQKEKTQKQETNKTRLMLQKVENQIHAEKYGLWQIIPVNRSQSDFERGRFKGGKVKFGEEIRFLNIKYKVYLSVRKVKVGRNKIEYEFGYEQTEEQNTVFEIINISSNSSFVTTQDLFLVRNINTLTYFTLSIPFTLNQTQGYMSPSLTYKKQDNFKFTKISFQQQWENNYLISTVPFIKQGIKTLDRINFIERTIIVRDQVMLRVMCQTLIHLLTFSFDLTEGFEASQNKLGKMTYNHFQVQKLLKEQGVIENIIQVLSKLDSEILLQLAEQEEVKLKKEGILNVIKKFGGGSDIANQSNKKLDLLLLKKIVNVCFKILRNCCKSNIENCLFMFKHINIVVKYLGLGSEAENFIIDTFTNFVILDKFTQEHFQSIIEEYKKVYRKKGAFTAEIFRLLSGLMKCDGKGINKNQLDIFRLFVHQDNPLLIPTKVIDGKIYVKNEQLRIFQKDSPKICDILGAQLKFLALLALDRNYICSKGIKQMFPLKVIFAYLIQDPVENRSLKQSFIWIIIHVYLNERPRFKKITPLTFEIPFEAKQQKKLQIQKYEIQMQIMRKEGYSEVMIQDIMSCIYQQDQIEQHTLQQFKKFLIKKIKGFSDQNQKLGQFFSYKMEAYLACLKNLIQLSVFRSDQAIEVSHLIQTISTVVQKSLNSKTGESQKLQSGSFRQLLLQMLQKNILKKFESSKNSDGIEDEVSQDNICSVFLNYMYYQNILLTDKKKKERKEKDAVIKKVLEIIEITNYISKGEIIKKFVSVLSSAENRLKSKNRSEVITNIVTGEIFGSQNKQKNQKIYSLLLMQFYNSNTFEINYLSLKHLLSEIFFQATAMEDIAKIQFHIDESEKKQSKELQKNCSSIRTLIETSQIWLNIYDITKGKNLKYDTVRLLFIGKLKKIIKYIMPSYEEIQDDPFNCLKYASSIITQKQQILANTKLHETIISFLQDYRVFKSKIRETQRPNQIVFIKIIKYCHLFMYALIYGSSSNKSLLRYFAKSQFNEYSNYAGKSDLGQTIFLTEYLRNNYQESINFYNQNIITLQKYQRYTALHSKLLLILTSYNSEPILSNLRKIYISIFDFTSFKEFLWLRPNGKEFNLDLNQFNTSQQPCLYHINVIQVILRILKGLQQSRSTIKQHLQKCFTPQYLFNILTLDDFYTKENSSNCRLRIMVHFKNQVLKLIQFIYFGPQLKIQNLVIQQFRRQNTILKQMILQSKARKQNQDFRKVYLVKGLKDEVQKKILTSTYENIYLGSPQENILQSFLGGIEEFSLNYKSEYERSTNEMIQKIVVAAQEIHGRVFDIYHLICVKSEKSTEDGKMVIQGPKTYPTPYEWLFSVQGRFKSQETIKKKQLYSSCLIQSIFNEQIYRKFKHNQIGKVDIICKTLSKINLRQFIFFRKVSQFLEDAFEKLQNEPTSQMYLLLKNLMKFLTRIIQYHEGQKGEKVRIHMGKSQLIFPILNYFEVCKFDKENKQLFLITLQFFNELIGENGNRTIQKMLNQYFKNSSNSKQFFMKIKNIFDSINLQEKINYKCKKIFQSIQAFEKDVQLEKKSEFIILTFFTRVCQGSYRDNQIFLSQLSSTTNFNLMSGIWQILKTQSKKYGKNLVNSQNYLLITQCFSTIRQIVEGPCVQNQNKFLKRDFFSTVLEYFSFVITENNLNLEGSIQEKIKKIERISPQFTKRLRIYLNRDKITEAWMPSQVKYQCVSLICSLLSENVNQESKSQLYAIPQQLIIKQLDKIYERYLELNLDYSYQNLQVQENTQVVLPLGFKLYQLLQYYPAEKIPKNSEGLNFFKQNSRVVEVVHHKLTVVVFPRIPQEISIGFRNKFIQQVDRSSINSKLRELQDAQVQNKQSDFPYGYLIFLCAVIITFLDIIIYDQQALPYVEYFTFYPIFRIYGFKFTEELVATVFMFICIFLSLIFFMLEIKGATYFRHQLSVMWNSDLSKWEKFKKIGSFLWSNLSYYHYFLTLFLCILSIFNPFFDALLLLVELYRRSQTFSSIIDAITSTLDQLLVVLLFTLVCTYVLTTLLYYYLAWHDYPDQCSNLYHCFVFSLDQGFRADAGIVGFPDDESTILEQFLVQNIEEVVVNFLYLFVIKIIIQQIIGAIIIDKFAALRQTREKLEQDQSSVCFICGLGRTLLDRQEDGFEIHKQQYHNRWNYFQFLIYIRNSKISNFTGIELYVYEQQKNRKLKWFPINRSYHLEEKIQKIDKQDEENEVEKLMKALDSEMNYLKGDLTKIWNYLNITMSSNNSNEGIKKIGSGK